MIPTSCSGCRATFAGNSYQRSTVKIALFSPEGAMIEGEVIHHLCPKCATKIRTDLDVIAGKTCSVGNSLIARVDRIEERIHETYHQSLNERVFKIEVALGIE